MNPALLALLGARVAASATLASDTFNRADGALGISDGPGTPAWVASQVTIVSNAATAIASNGRAFLAAGQADMKVTAQLGSTLPSGPCARSDGSLSGTYYRALAAGGTWYIVHVAGGTATVLDSWSRPQPAAGDTMSLAAVTSGANVALTVYHNGAIVRTFTDSIYKLTGTYAGLFAGSSGAIFDGITVTPA